MARQRGDGDRVRVRLVVHGLVQGVGFRYAAHEAASEIGVSGWVRNLPDGSVEIEAQGSPAAVTRMTEWVRRGPRHAAVRRVDVEAAEPRADATEFDIRR